MNVKWTVPTCLKTHAWSVQIIMKSTCSTDFNSHSSLVTAILVASTVPVPLQGHWEKEILGTRGLTSILKAQSRLLHNAKHWAMTTLSCLPDYSPSDANLTRVPTCSVETERLSFSMEREMSPWAGICTAFDGHPSILGFARLAYAAAGERLQVGFVSVPYLLTWPKQLREGKVWSGPWCEGIVHHGGEVTVAGLLTCLSCQKASRDEH